ncbi:hypothetical protein DSO57_1023383 [Entomophthora muscae]|uniref:Uncharacterized protein n=1 Tax=Entomophthora muscae TaxID=34485 RepID=A0ACC2TQF2_9FUNG|nr:hypothetical protein DSO57_1023383 [Entomophthora muscae]
MPPFKGKGVLDQPVFDLLEAVSGYLVTVFSDVSCSLENSNPLSLKILNERRKGCLVGKDIGMAEKGVIEGIIPLLSNQSKGRKEVEYVLGLLCAFYTDELMKILSRVWMYKYSGACHHT